MIDENIYVRAIQSFVKDCYYSYIDCYTNSTNCTGRCEDYCRCKKVIGIEINKIYYNSIANDTLELLNIENPALKSLLFQFIKTNIDSDSFDYTSVGGYYGEELDSVYLIKSEAKNIVDFCIKHMNKEDSFLVQNSLLYEHNILLEKYKNISVERKSITYKDLISKAKITNTSTDIERIKEIYSSEDFAGMILEDKGRYYNFVDGNHRFQALLNKIAKNNYYDIEIYSQKEIDSFKPKSTKNKIEVLFIKENNEVKLLKERVAELEEEVARLRK